MLLTIITAYFVTAVIDGTGLSRTDAALNLQPNITGTADFPDRNTESSQDIEVPVGVRQSGGYVSIRHNEIPLKTRCQHCSFTCNNDSQLVLHMKAGHGSGAHKSANFKCPECSMSFAKKDVLFWHLSHHIGNHSIMYYACSACNTERQHSSEIWKHIGRKHSGRLSQQVRMTALVEKVHYLQNIMKCPICNDGLLWKHIYVEHLQDKHNLVDLASYLDTNYSDTCPDMLSFPAHLLKASVKNHASLVTGVEETAETLTISRFHCESCEFSTNDSGAFQQHQNSHSQTRTESASVPNKVRTSSAKAAPTTNVLHSGAKSDRTAKLNANSHIMAPVIPKKRKQSSKRKTKSSQQKIQSSKRKINWHQKSVAPKQTIARSEEYVGPYFSRSSSATDALDVSDKTVAKPTSANDAGFLTEFVNKLPSCQVFAEDIKCPKCFFASRVRCNLMRHIKTHVATDNRSVTSASESCKSDVHLSYDLWKPDLPHQQLREEPAGTENADVADTDANDASVVSQNSTDNDSQEQLTTAEESGVSHSVCGSEEVEADGGMPVQSERLMCETCTKEFDSDVDLEWHISKSHDGPYVCHLCGILLWQKTSVRHHYGVKHPGSQVLFEVFHKKAVDGSREVAGGGKSGKKIARVQGVKKKKTQLTESSNTSSDTSSQQQQQDGVREPDSCSAAAGTESTPPPSSASQSAAAATSQITISEVQCGLSSEAPTAVDSTPCSFGVSSSSASQLLSSTSSGVSTSSSAAPSALPVSLDSLMAALGSMESIAMIAARLVPLLATLDTQLLMQMIQVANPAVAVALSAYCAQSAAAAQMPADISQSAAAMLQSALQSGPEGLCASGVPQNQASATVTQSADAVRCGSTASCSSFQSSVCSREATGSDVGNASVPTDAAPSETRSEQRHESPDRNPSPFDTCRPPSTASTSSSIHSTDRRLRAQDTASARGALVYTCHLCPFRSSKRTRFAEHLSSEFSTTNILTMARQAPDGDQKCRKRCSHCSFSTYLCEEYDEHVRTHASSSSYRCAYCDYNGPNVGALKQHFRRSHRNKSFVFHPSTLGQKLHGQRPNSDRPSVPQPRCISLDPVVATYNVATLNHSDIRKLKSRYAVTKINICD